MNVKTNIQSLTLYSIFVACIVFALKYWAYHITGSVALYSDALESIVNILATLAAWWAVKVSMKPADHDHPFGHHKAEYFSAILEGILIIIAAIIILREAWIALSTVKLLQKPGIWLVIHLVASVINYLWGWVLIRQGNIHRSPALKADGVHFITDVFTSVAILIGLVAGFMGGWSILDPILAIIVAVNILLQGWKVIRSAVQGLMDVGVELNETMRIRELISANAQGALEVHDLLTRVAGRVTFIEFHLVVPAAMSVGEAHQICDKIEAVLQEEFDNVRISIHVEPENEAKLPLGTTVVPFI
ncbi:cation diffusion facilitator family transporter [Bartonella vinsonii subsp. arupensis OK-94-513]|uniref:Cation diffusion facilitator family transporter n=2 Tax=Bartonella vinsonii subsp. arupensis TaxID=110578 RepID=J1JTU1_BARVI|nr:cation diffusion facilitator family transporter [Bartonella vinsonii]EJF88342.1 cation diffusion facilitator family transporter [Bartonella vinsonii subsp. arupensis OK-94-513]EJF97450.1 cation diffusion facilitator family transporter [Bartonella vinsonii subsp. arupensis Pm136co]